MSKEYQLRSACYNDDLDEVKRLVNEGVDVESTDEGGWTPLIYAAKTGHVDIVRFLLDRGANIDMKNVHGNTALHWAAWNGKDEAVTLLIERGANLHMKTSKGRTPLDGAKLFNRSSTAAILIIETAMQSIKVIYTSSQDLQQDTVTFKNFSNNIIIVGDNNIPNGFEFEEHPVITLQHIQQCLDQLPNSDDEDNISPKHIHDILARIHPTIATRLQYWGLNVLHLIAYLPSILSNDTSMNEAISTILSKCPQASTSVDICGMTPLHHAVINLSKKKTSQECHDVLLARSSPIVVHKAIQAGMGWENLRPIVMAKLNALTVVDEESSLVPFMLAAERCKNDHVDGTLGSLSMVYELLCLGPDVIKEYDESVLVTAKRTLDGGRNSSDQDKKCSRRV